MKQKNNERVDFHVECDDYFATLGTLLYLLEEELDKTEKAFDKTLREMRKVQGLAKKSLREAKDDLIYLQRRFRITER